MKNNHTRIKRARKKYRNKNHGRCYHCKEKAFLKINYKIWVCDDCAMIAGELADN